MSSMGRNNLLCPPRAESRITDDGRLVWLAPAKLNLFLRVVGPRPDGYHEIDSVAAKITFHDEIILRRREDAVIDLECSEFDCGPVEENLVRRAADLLRKGGGPPGADIRLVKRIPPGAGLGGGSSDAAAALRALNRLWGLGLTAAALSALAAELGSDVPLFLAGPAVRVRGRGERVEPVAVAPFWALVYTPEVHCPTGAVYAAHDAIAPAAGPPSAPPLEALTAPPSRWRGELVNDLVAAAERVRPVLARCRRRLGDATGLPVHMSGSGSALFVLLDGVEHARRALAAVPEDMLPHCRVAALNSW